MGEGGSQGILVEELHLFVLLVDYVLYVDEAHEEAVLVVVVDRLELNFYELLWLILAALSLFTLYGGKYEAVVWAGCWNYGLKRDELPHSTNIQASLVLSLRLELLLPEYLC